MLRKNGHLRQNADAEPGRDRGMNAEDAGARLGDVPGPTHHLERMDCPIAVQASLLEYGERQRIAPEIDRATAADDPVQTLGPSRNATGFFRIALEQRNVDLATFERASHTVTLSAAYVEA